MFEWGGRLDPEQRLKQPRCETRITNRFLAALATASVAMVVVPPSANSQQQQTPPTASVTAVPTTEATGDGGELEKVTVTGYIIPRIGDGTQPVMTLNHDFISKQVDQMILTDPFIFSVSPRLIRVPDVMYSWREYFRIPKP